MRCIPVTFVPCHLSQEDDKLRRATEGGASASTSLQEMLPFAGTASAQTLKKLAALAREREDMLKVCVIVAIMLRASE